MKKVLSFMAMVLTWMAGNATEYITSVNITLDQSETVLSPAYTHNEYNESLVSNWGGSTEHCIKNWALSNTSNMYALASADGVTYYRTNRTDNPTGFNEEDNVNAAYQYKILISVAADYDGGYDFDGTNPDGIAITFNGETVSGAKVTDYNSYWHTIDIEIPVAVNAEAIVRSVTVTPTGENVTKGKTKQYTATVDGTAAKTVTWTVSGNSSASTTISEGGLADIRRGRRVRVNHDNCDFDSRRN